MSVLGKIGRIGARVGTAWVSGGASELYRSRTGHADPVTAYGEHKLGGAGDAISNQVGEVVKGGGSTVATAVPSGETTDEAARRKQLESNSDADLNAARAYRDKLNAEPAAGPRPAPYVSGPGFIGVAQAGAPTTVTSTLDTSQADEDRQAYQAYIDKQRAIAEGRAGPSAAELQMRAGNARAVAAQYAIASGARGYSQGALRQAGMNVAGLQQQNINDTAALRAQEQAAANERLGTAIATGRTQDINVATTKGAQDLEAQKANQTAKLQTDLANAGFDQQSILHLSDQELQAKLANAGFQLTQEQMDDLRAKTQRDQQLQASGQVLTAGQAATGTAEDRAARLAQLQQMQAEARARGDAATDQMIGTIIATYLQYGTSGGGGSAGSSFAKYDPDAPLPLGYTH